MNHLSFRVFSLLAVVLSFSGLAYSQSENLVPAASAIPADSTAKEIFIKAQNFAVHPEGRAPALTRMYIQNVCVDAAGTSCETISSSQALTTNVYHSTNAYVFIWEIGYGQGEKATQGGITMDDAYLSAKTDVCLSGQYYVTPCPGGGTVVGSRYVWNSGHYLYIGYGTLFAAQDTSLVSPYNAFNVSLNIQYTK